MKIALFQSPYSLEFGKIDEYNNLVLKYLDEVVSPVDLIVFPESCSVQSVNRNKQEYYKMAEKYNDVILNKAIQTAKRCKATLFINLIDFHEKGLRNTTFCINKQGEIVGKYYKAHPAPSEVKDEDKGGVGLDCSYSYEYFEPYTITIDNVKYAFLTCYDFYFYEFFPQIARQNVDIIIGCSHQRTDTHETLNTIGKFLSYNTNAFLVRSSVSLSENSKICGSSMVVSPSGEMLLDMVNRTGIEYVDIDHTKKHYKPAGFNGVDKSHHEYIEEGRRPWLYRPAGSFICPQDEFMSYPRICAHRGIPSILPENSIMGLASAISLGAKEIEFDIWPTIDGEIVSIHDSKLDRVSNGSGLVYEKTYEELKSLDFGVKYDEKFKGLKIPTLEEILKKFSCHAVMNIHVKDFGKDKPYPTWAIEKIVSLIKKYDVIKHCYLMINNDLVISQFKNYEKNLSICVGTREDEPYSIVDRAINLKAQKVQFYNEYLNKELIEKAHKNGIICNLFFCDDLADAKKYLDMGIDTILTNKYNLFTDFLDNYKK